MMGSWVKYMAWWFGDVAWIPHQKSSKLKTINKSSTIISIINIKKSFIEVPSGKLTYITMEFITMLLMGKLTIILFLLPCSSSLFLCLPGRVNLHFPMVFLWVFPLKPPFSIIFLWQSPVANLNPNQRVTIIKKSSKNHPQIRHSFSGRRSPPSRDHLPLGRGSLGAGFFFLVWGWGLGHESYGIYTGF